MTIQKDGHSPDLDSLQKRAKELNCLYRIKDILQTKNKSVVEISSEVTRAIPSGMLNSHDCHVKITIDKNICTTTGFVDTAFNYTKNIACHDITVGSIKICYIKDPVAADNSPFYREEIKLIDTIAGLLGQYIVSLNIRNKVLEIKNKSTIESHHNIQEWPTLVDMVKYTNRELYCRICRKILNVLNLGGNEEVNKLLVTINSSLCSLKGSFGKGNYYPIDKNTGEFPLDVSQIIIKTAQTYISDDVMLQHIQKWLQEEKLAYLAQVVNRNLSLEEVADSIRRYYKMAPIDQELRYPSKWGIQISLIRRFLSEQAQYINIAKHTVDIKDFNSLLNNMVFSIESRGKLGGKSAILFLIDQIIKKELKDDQFLENIKIPKTWFVSSDVVYDFMHYNNFDDVVEQKYKDSDQIRIEYPQIARSFINGQFPKDIIKKLSAALDDLHDKPLIVRSSSLLENQIGSTFFGKYKSIILVNKGSKRERLNSLMAAIAEIYASTFSPTPIEYRRKNDLLDFGEEMGIMIQEMVGTSIGRYYLPLCSGIAYSDNIYRWSENIKQEDGLICMSPGFRIRQENHNRIDSPVLIIPGQPELNKAYNSLNNATHLPESIIAINMESGQVEQTDAVEFLRENGSELHRYQEIASVVKNNKFEKISKDDIESGDLRITFEDMLRNNPLVEQINSIIRLMKSKLNMPIDIEFAYNGTDLYILQCRSYNYLNQNMPVTISQDTPNDVIIFSADHYIVNRNLPEIKYIVYIDPLQYRDRSNKQNIVAINNLVKKLNKRLPRKQYIVIGPWMLKGKMEKDFDIETALSDIDNSAALIEVTPKSSYTTQECPLDPYLFHDLINNDIQYLVLKEHDDGCALNIRFLRETTNIISDSSAEEKEIYKIIRLIDIKKETNGMVMQISMNAESNKALGYLIKHEPQIEKSEQHEKVLRPQKENYWQWRLKMVEKIASKIDAERFGVKNIYVFGSTKNASAGPCSDIDLLVHHDSSPKQLNQLKLWLEGWSLCLDEMNYLRTGYQSDGLLDVQYITDEDIVRKTSFAIMIDAVTDRARRVPLKGIECTD